MASASGPVWPSRFSAERAIPLLQALLQDSYGLTASGITPTALGTVNRNYRVTTGDGEYILKHYLPGNYSRAEVARSCMVQDRLRGQGVPVAAIRPNRDGDLLTETPDGIFALSEFVAGQHCTRGQIPPGAARAMGRTLGLLHRALGAMGPLLDGPQGAPDPYAFPRRERALARFESILTLVERRRAESPVDEAACLILRSKVEALTAMSEDDIPTPLPAQWVHGDYQETNVLFDTDAQVAAVLDFDNLRRLPRSIEVMRAFAFSFSTGEGPAAAAYDFVAGYRESMPVAEAELARWARDWRYYSLCRDWPIGARYEEPDRYDLRWDRFIVYRPDWWAANHAAVAARLCG